MNCLRWIGGYCATGFPHWPTVAITSSRRSTCCSPASDGAVSFIRSISERGFSSLPPQVNRRSACEAQIARAFGDQARGCGLDIILKLGKDHIPIATRRNRVKDLHSHLAEEAQEAATRPEQAGIECDRHAGNAGFRIEVDDPELVFRVSPGRPARALRENDDLAAFGERLAGMH